MVKRCATDGKTTRVQLRLPSNHIFVVITLMGSVLWLTALAAQFWDEEKEDVRN